jgi:prephenate dehydratase
VTARVGYLGPVGTFTHGAALDLCPGAELIPLSTQAVAIEAVSAGEIDAAVVPVDNSVHGLVLPTWDSLLGSVDATIVADTTVPVTFDAFVKPGSSTPRVIVSHPHALAQCSEFVQAQGLATRAASSTAEACRTLADGEMAIAAPLCGDLYGLDVVDRGVEDVVGAATQFGKVVSPARRSDPVQPATDASVLLLAVVPQHNEAGSLLSVLSPIREAGLNLVNILARPIAHSDREFLFLLFVEGMDEAAEHSGLLGAIRGTGATVANLGRLSGHVRHVTPATRSLPRRMMADG